jgi:hypothetical protein
VYYCSQLSRFIKRIDENKDDCTLERAAFLGEEEDGWVVDARNDIVELLLDPGRHDRES